MDVNVDAEAVAGVEIVDGARGVEGTSGDVKDGVDRRKKRMNHWVIPIASLADFSLEEIVDGELGAKKGELLMLMHALFADCYWSFSILSHSPTSLNITFDVFAKLSIITPSADAYVVIGSSNDSISKMLGVGLWLGKGIGKERTMDVDPGVEKGIGQLPREKEEEEEEAEVETSSLNTLTVASSLHDHPPIPIKELPVSGGGDVKMDELNIQLTHLMHELGEERPIFTCTQRAFSSFVYCFIADSYLPLSRPSWPIHTPPHLCQSLPFPQALNPWETFHSVITPRLCRLSPPHATTSSPLPTPWFPRPPALSPMPMVPSSPMVDGGEIVGAHEGQDECPPSSDIVVWSPSPHGPLASAPPILSWKSSDMPREATSLLLSIQPSSPHAPIRYATRGIHSARYFSLMPSSPLQSASAPEVKLNLKDFALQKKKKQE
ncbi:hypothetical protein BDQ17DRAFT_1434936 [Cyathus striatus]|nr:hypothetical protein BDQ17DRAFT_1434936 [Cyathus striatus]